jgi:hypothetical protein
MRFKITLLLIIIVSIINLCILHYRLGYIQGQKNERNWLMPHPEVASGETVTISRGD